jgi:N-acetylmuramoyl-L-alanine amidase
MTKRSEKQYVTNRKRAEIANSCHALLFLRLHCDSAGGSGYTLYYPAHAITKQGVTGPSVKVQKESRIASLALLKGISPELKGYMKENRIKTDDQTAVGKRQGGALTGSVFSRVPTVLIEMGDMSHPQDLTFLNSKSGQQRMAQALTSGIITYLHLCCGKKN